MKPIETIIASLNNGPMLLKQLMEQIPESRWHEKDSYPWSIAEHCNHICLSDELVFHKRIHLITHEGCQEIQAINGKSFGDDFYFKKNVQEEIAKFLQARKKTIKMVESLSESQLNQQVFHPEYTEYNLSLIHI